MMSAIFFLPILYLTRPVFLLVHFHLELLDPREEGCPPIESTFLCTLRPLPMLLLNPGIVISHIFHGR